MKKIFRFIAAAALVCLFAACKKDPIEVQSVSLDKTTLTMVEDSSVQLTATVKPDNATEKNVNWSSSDKTIATVSADGKVTAVKAGTATIIVSTADGGKTATCAVTVLANIDGALNGLFSVSATKKVRFSKGNLRAFYFYSGIYEFRFAANQYDYIGNAPGNTTIGSQSNGNLVDLFGWSTSKTNFGISTSKDNADYSGDFVDWGKNIGDGSTWRTLFADEWVYLFKARTNASNLFRYGVTVCGKTDCLIIAPDGFTGSIASSYDVSTWPAAEAAGLVCLPAAGGRISSSVYDVGDIGNYWSSSADDENVVYSVKFKDDDVYPDGTGFRFYGFSVRLVTECQ